MTHVSGERFLQVLQKKRHECNMVIVASKEGKLDGQ